MKYCSKCGNELNDDDKYCPKCGTKVEVNQFDNERDVYSNNGNNQFYDDSNMYNQNDFNNNANTSSGKTLGLIGIITTFLCSPFVGLIFSLIGLAISIKDKSKNGKTYSIVGIVCSAIFIILIIALLIIYYVGYDNYIDTYQYEY